MGAEIYSFFALHLACAARALSYESASENMPTLRHGGGGGGGATLETESVLERIGRLGVCRTFMFLVLGIWLLSLGAMVCINAVRGYSHAVAHIESQRRYHRDCQIGEENRNRHWEECQRARIEMDEWPLVGAAHYTVVQCWSVLTALIDHFGYLFIGLCGVLLMVCLVFARFSNSQQQQQMMPAALMYGGGGGGSAVAFYGAGKPFEPMYLDQQQQWSTSVYPQQLVERTTRVKALKDTERTVT